MSSKEDIIKLLNKMKVTKIAGQLNDRALVHLKKELVAIAMSISTIRWVSTQPCWINHP